MPLIIDAHEDLAYAALCYQRNYCLSAAEIRHNEKELGIPGDNGEALLGWPEFQKGRVAVVFGTIFIIPQRFNRSTWSKRDYKNSDEARQQYEEQFDFYKRLEGDNPEKFRIIKTGQDLSGLLGRWNASPVDNSPVGIVMLMEGAEGILHTDELEEYWHMGLRIIGPVWGGGRFCGGMIEKGKFTREGFEFLDVMQNLHFALDIAHMSEESGFQALDRYEGPLLASHANARALLKDPPGDRHLTDDAIRLLVERDGVIGVLPYNRFIKPDWKPGDNREDVTLHSVADHVDHICQLSGNASHVGFGTDFDGGFGWPEVPLEIDTIADMQKLSPILTERGYTTEDIAGIFGLNWQHFLERSLPKA